MNETSSEVADLVAGVLEIAPATLTDDTPLATIDDFDSLRQLNLLLALEERFGIQLAPEDVQSLVSVSEITRLVEARR